MPFSRPTLTQLRDSAISEINALIPGADARVRFSMLNVFARVWAALVDGLYSVLVFLSRQLFAVTATREYLTLIGDSYGVIRLPRTAAQGCINLTGFVGTSIPIGSTFQRSDGIQYTTTLGVAIPITGVIDVPCIAVIVGTNTNSAAGTQVNPVSQIVGLNSASVCSAGISGGSDEESDDALRERILARLRNPPGVGTASDWERWARAMGPSVTRVWVIPLVYGGGSVGIVFAEDNAAVVPAPASIAQMQAHLAQFTPVGSAVTVFAPTLIPANFTIHEVPTGNPQVRANIILELTDLLYREAGPGATIARSHITEAISSALGETDHSLVFPTLPLAYTAIAPTFQVGIMGSVTWV